MSGLLRFRCSRKDRKVFCCQSLHCTLNHLAGSGTEGVGCLSSMSMQIFWQFVLSVAEVMVFVQECDDSNMSSPPSHLRPTGHHTVLGWKQHWKVKNSESWTRIDMEPYQQLLAIARVLGLRHQRLVCENIPSNYSQRSQKQEFD